MKKMAHIVEGRVVNISLWDGVSNYQTLEDVVEIPERTSAGIGWDYINGKFVDNRPAEDWEGAE